jgi:hypothetical protein
MTHPASISAGAAKYIPSNQNCAACRAYDCEDHQSPGVRSLKPKRLQAMDAAPAIPDPDGAVTRNRRVDEESLATAERRQKAGQDDEPHVPGCRCKPCGTKRAADTERKFRTVDQVMNRVVNITKKKRAADAQRAWDKAVEADQLADQRKQDRIAAADQTFFAAVRAPWDRKYAKDDASPEIGELSPGGGSFASHAQQEGKVQRASNLHVTKPGKGRTCDPYANYEGNYGPIAAALRGEDAQPLTGEAKQAAIVAADKAHYAREKARWGVN